MISARACAYRTGAIAEAGRPAITVRVGSSVCMTFHSVAAMTPSLISDLPVWNSVSVENIRLIPCAGLTRDRSGISAAALRKKPVCSSVTAMAATQAPMALGRAARSTPAAVACRSGWLWRSDRANHASGVPMPAFSWIDSTARPPARPPRRVNSRETGMSPSSRAFCRRR